MASYVFFLFKCLCVRVCLCVYVSFVCLRLCVGVRACVGLFVFAYICV